MPPLQGGSREFESLNAHHLKPLFYDRGFLLASVVWLGDKNPKDCSYHTSIDCNTNPGTIRLADAYYVGVTKPEISQGMYDGADWVIPYKYQVSYIHYYKDDGYIEYNKIGYDTDRTVSTKDYVVSYT